MSGYNPSFIVIDPKDDPKPVKTTVSLKRKIGIGMLGSLGAAFLGLGLYVNFPLVSLVFLMIVIFFGGLYLAIEG